MTPLPTKLPSALRSWLVATLALTLLVFGIAPADAASGRLTFQSGGQTRSAFVVEQQRLKRGARATLIILHGGSGSGLRTRRTLGLEDVIRSQGVAVVYPDAIDGRWDLSDKGAPRETTMVRDLIRKLVDERISDRKRIYILGLSTGGMVALRYACDYADTLAAGGALISAMPEALAQSCKPSKPLPFFFLAGTANPYLPYNGGPANLRDYKGAIASVAASLAPFKTAAGCGDVLKTTTYPDKDPGDQSRVVLETYKDCKVPIEFVHVEGGGHTIPGRWRGPTDRGISPGVHNNDVDASRLIWEFFKNTGA